MKLVIDIPDEDFTSVRCEALYYIGHDKLAESVTKAFQAAVPYDERPHGEWVISQTMDCHSDIINVYTCPFCGKKEYSAYPFCHCGADMREENENDK